jgi:perosamine synthetase
MFTMFKKIQLDAPCVGEREKKYLCQAIDSGFVSSVGPCISEFENKIAAYLGVKAAVAVQSGTAALYMALYELGIKEGDEVIVPAITFAATVNPILYVGATPVIVDVDPQTWNIDPIKVKDAITKKTKAIIPVHVYGNPSSMIEIMALAQAHGIAIVEDATESIGATFNRKATGTFGNFGCLSFNGNKVITTGGGGMIVGNDSKKIEHIRYLVNQAKDKEQEGFHSEMGFNFRMTNIEAALGLAQLEQIEIFLSKKRAFKAIYQDILSNVDGVSFQKTSTDALDNAWLISMTIKGPVKDVMARLKQKDIPTRRVFPPLAQMPYLKQFSAHCPVAEKIYDQGICLPSSVVNDEKDVKEAALIIREILQG